MDWKCCILLFMWKLSFSLSSPRCMLTIKILILGHMPHQTNYLCKFAFNIWFPTDGRMQNYKAKIWKMLLIKAALNFNKKASNKLQSVFDGDVVKNSHHFSFIRIFDKKIAYILQAQKNHHIEYEISIYAFFGVFFAHIVYLLELKWHLRSQFR